MKTISKLRNECYDLVNKIIKKDEINKELLMTALAFRMNMHPDNCRISKFDEENCKKCLKMLQKML